MSRTLKIIIISLVILSAFVGFQVWNSKQMVREINNIGIVVELADDKAENQAIINACEIIAAENDFKCNVYETGINPTSDAIVENLDTAAVENDLIIANGYRFGDEIITTAATYQTKYFVLANYELEIGDQENLAVVNFEEAQSGYLAGVAAATLANESNSNIIGFIGGEDIPTVNRYYYGYILGAQSVNPEIEILEWYTNDFYNIESAEAAADKMIEYGASVIFTAAGSANQGTFAAVEQNYAAGNPAYIIGSNTNECLSYGSPAYCITSVGKNYEQVLYDVIDAINAKDFAKNYGNQKKTGNFENHWLNLEQTVILTDATKINSVVNQTLEQFTTDKLNVDASSIVTKEDVVEATKKDKND